MNRTNNSFLSSLKWWPSLQSNNSDTNIEARAETCSRAGPIGAGGLKNIHTFGSSVAVQKLRESKWFKSDEERIFCAVIESGFIVEIRQSGQSLLVDSQAHNKTNNTSDRSSQSCNSYRNSSEEVPSEDDLKFLNNNSKANEDDHQNDDDDNDENNQLQNENTATSWFGVVLCKTKDKKTRPDTIEIYSVRIRANGTFRIIKKSLDDLWKKQECEIRINNFADKEKRPHNEKDIRNQVAFARKSKQSLWNNNKHFVYWCRYGSRQQDVRKRQMSECAKWSSVGMNVGMLLLLNKQE